ncbi:hypothetical protein ACQKOE_07535 [Novosphingobium sp. NPDC080210]|uniref:hypothetical protein n=1 Tax=Novosphingobium sp. NPDC080210 TaxID=3390596 RepID=UPI003CFBF1EB
MTKTKKKPATAAPSPALVAAAAKSTEIAKLVRLARVFIRVGAQGPFEVSIPLFASQHIAGKGYRKGNVPVGTRLNTDIVRLGKRDGLLFRLIPVDGLVRNGNEQVEFIEVNWDDIVASIPDIYMETAARLDERDFVKNLDAALVAAIKQNDSIHPILEAGFAKAQEEEKAEMSDETMTDNPLFGTF